MSAVTVMRHELLAVPLAIRRGGHMIRNIIRPDVSFRPAVRSDANHIARLTDAATEALFYYLWQKSICGGGDPWAVGRKAAEQENGDMSYRDTVICDLDGTVAGCLISYVMMDQAPSVDCSKIPAVFRPVAELEDMAIGTCYISALALYPEFRGRGIGAQFLRIAAKFGQDRIMSLVVSDGNRRARELYERNGYRAHASRPMVKECWRGVGENWILMLK